MYNMGYYMFGLSQKGQVLLEFSLQHRQISYLDPGENTDCRVDLTLFLSYLNNLLIYIFTPFSRIARSPSNRAWYIWSSLHIWSSTNKVNCTAPLLCAFCLCAFFMLFRNIIIAFVARSLVTPLWSLENDNLKGQ